MEALQMHKTKMNVTLDRDLIDYIKQYAEEQRTSVSEIITQFILNLKRSKENEPMELIFSDPKFRKCLLKTIKREGGRTRPLAPRKN